VAAPRAAGRCRTGRRRVRRRLCDGSGNVGVDELTRLVGLALGEGAAVPCPRRPNERRSGVGRRDRRGGRLRARGCQPRRRRRLPEALCPQYNPLGTSTSATCRPHAILVRRSPLDTRTTPAEPTVSPARSLGLRRLTSRAKGRARAARAAARLHRGDRPLRVLGEVETCATPGSPPTIGTCQLFPRAYARLRQLWGRMTGSQPALSGRLCGRRSRCVWTRRAGVGSASRMRPAALRSLHVYELVAYEYHAAPAQHGTPQRDFP